MLAVIATATWPGVPAALVTVLGAATFVTTVASGIDYVLTYARLAWRESRRAKLAA